MHTTVISCVIADLELIKVRAAFLQPLQEFFKALSLRVVHRNIVVLLILGLGLLKELFEILIGRLKIYRLLKGLHCSKIVKLLSQGLCLTEMCLHMLIQRGLCLP